MTDVTQSTAAAVATAVGAAALAAATRPALRMRPGDPGFDEAVTPWNFAYPHRPSAVVVAGDPLDVAAAVATAHRSGVGVAVQTTGHGVVMQADDDAVLIAMSQLNSVTIDPLARTATVGGGAKFDAVLAAAQAHGLAPLLGSSPDVGAVGYSLGGGLGWLARPYGLGVDAVRSLRVVVADGSLVTASPEENAELFWGMCGTGGSSFGVVVSMTIALAPVTEVYAGSLFYPADAAWEVFTRYRAVVTDAPVELTSAFNVTAFPPLDIVPEPIRGKTFAIVRGAHTGSGEEASRFADGWRAWREPLVDMFGPLPFGRVAEISQDPVDPLPAAATGGWLSSLSDDVGAAMIDAVTGEHGLPVLFAEARHAGGAVARPNPDVCFEARNAPFAVEAVALVPAPEVAAGVDAVFDTAWRRIGDAAAPLPGYLNFIEGPERRARASSAFSEQTWQRLAALKAGVDPDNVFRYGVL